MDEPSEGERCPDCGAEIVSEPGIPRLCPQCLLSLALKDSGPLSDPDEVETLHRAAPGRILGERYQVREMLGRGGMGEVFRAFDLKLRVDVALKALREVRLENEGAQDLLRREVRSAREVVSPNVCRIFDLVVEGGQELVSMEYVDGHTLSERLKERGPLTLQESREIASQFLSGLEAIHQAGLVHRDFKPENVMVTRAGRVVVMDFGLAKANTEGRTGTISGTPAYMAPEQARGEAVDARADVFAAGVVLAEMLSVGGEANPEARQALWRAVRETPPRVPEGPWAPVLRQALAPDPGERQASAHALARALEEVTLRLPGFEEERPYPGLASFTEQDSEYFFGREAEVEAVWRKLKRPRLLALIGPSGAGKSSFLRAGLLPTLPSTWKAVIATPGSHPFQALAETLVPAFSGDTQALQALLRFEDQETAVHLLQRFRERHEHVLVIVDQFEELFTLSPPEVQDAFARLLGRLVLEADIHVILSLRDDFLLRCHAHESLAPAFSDLTPLGTLSESALRRALVQPALACGYRFEDEALVDEMVAGVARERGALPLLAFAASRLWEKRDRERGLLTREAYAEIGGVAGALAQHAEATLGRIGTERITLVRELFRNLVTSQGTRAVRERGELLSVFARDQDPKASTEAGEVLDALVDARLLTSYERAGEGGESHQQVEIIHESLLSAWPRLVRWQTQDADGAQLRDQLRQAAQLWQDRGQHADLLWSGQVYRDFALWRERYPVPLTATEEAFARAMLTSATRRARRRRATVAAFLVIAVAVAIVMSVLWQRAQKETLRAEAGKLLVLGERELLTYPTGALAYTLKSLELSDTEAGRLLAIRVLQRAPVARLAPISKGYAGLGAYDIAFSPNAEWVAWGGVLRAELLDRDGQKRVLLGGDYAPSPDGVGVGFGPGGDVLVGVRKGDIRVWSIPDGRELRRTQVDEGHSSLRMGKDGFVTLTWVGQRGIVRSWPFDSGEPSLVGSMDVASIGDFTGRVLAYARSRAVYLRSFEDWAAPPRLVLEQPTEVQNAALSPDGARIATLDAAGDVRIWPTATRSTRPERVFQAPDTEFLRFDSVGRWLAATATVRGRPNVRLFDLTAPPGTDPLVLQRGDISSVVYVAFDPSGRWLATAHDDHAAFWPLDTGRALVLRGHRGAITSLLFTPDGRWLLSASQDNTVRAWPLGDPGSEVRILLEPPLLTPIGMALDPSGGRVAVSAIGRVYVVRLDGGPVRTLEGFSEKASLGTPAFDEGGRFVAAGPCVGPRDQKVVRVWDLETGAARTLGPLPGAGNGPHGGIGNVQWMGRDRLLASAEGVGIVSFDLSSGASRVVAAQPGIGNLSVSRDGRFGIAMSAEDRGVPGRVVRINLEDGKLQLLASHGTRPNAIALDPSDSVLASSSSDGIIRIGPGSGEEPHLLLGHEGGVNTVAFSPDGRWLASAGDDFTIRLWPVPNVSKPPLHRRPYAELLRLLRSHTNLRAVPDSASATGYKLEPGPFPGWAKPPEW